MTGKSIKAFAFVFLSLLPLRARAQEVSAGGAANFMTSTPAITSLVQEPRIFVSADVAISWKTADCELARMYRSPRLGIGLSYAGLGLCEFVPGSRAGDIYTLYGFIQRDLLSLGAFSAGYFAQIGGALMTHPYHKINNPGNLLYGGPFTFHVKGGLFARAQVSKEWSLGLEVGFRHNSASRIFIPNRGVNAVTLGLEAGYAFGPATVSPWAGRESDASQKVNRRFRFSVFAGGGIHKCMSEFYAARPLPVEEQPVFYTPWFKGSTGVEAVWRYCRRTSTGAQLELHYLGNIEALRKADLARTGKEADKYSPLSPGISLIQELYFGQFSLGVGIGAYFYREVGIKEYHGPLYQKVMFRYYPPHLKTLYVGASLRAHTFDQADYLELSLGWII